MTTTATRTATAGATVLTTLAAAQFLMTLDSSVMNVSIATVAEDVGTDVSTLSRGDVVLAPFVHSDGTCTYCRDGLQTSCRAGGFWGTNGVGAGQAEAVRVPNADGTLVPVPVGPREAGFGEEADELVSLGADVADAVPPRQRGRVHEDAA